MKANPIKFDHVVEKLNILNEMRATNMTLQELRFFSIYLSKINARDPKTKLVRFSLKNFESIMDLSRCQPKDLKSTVDNLLGKIIHVPTKDGGFEAFQIFKKCRIDQDEDGIWYVEIDAHDDALPLMFEFKDSYFTYQLWNALRLKSVNQLRMYELLKQYEKIGERTIDLDDLRLLLGIEPHEYPRWERLRVRVLDSCKKALEGLTDIRFDYEPIKKENGRKIVAVKFYIRKNTSYTNPLTLDEFMNVPPHHPLKEELEIAEKVTEYDEHLQLIAEACECEFSNKEMQVVFNLLVPIRDDLKRYLFVKSQYDIMKMYAKLGNVKHPYAYFKKLVMDNIKAV
jgi:plasmid replication initiation protein